MSSLFVYCAGGYGKEVIEVARRYNSLHGCWEAIHFLDDVCTEPARHEARIFAFDDACEHIGKHGGEVVIASGEPSLRATLRMKLQQRGLRLGRLVDATSIVSQP